MILGGKWKIWYQNATFYWFHPINQLLLPIQQMKPEREGRGGRQIIFREDIYTRTGRQYCIMGLKGLTLKTHKM